VETRSSISPEPTCSGERQFGYRGHKSGYKKERLSMSTLRAKAEVQAAEPVLLAGLVNYQDGSIVSRVLVGRDTGTVTLFAFDEGQGLSEHTAPFDALVQMLKGEMEISIDGKPLNVKAGHLLLMPANHPHALKAVTRSKMLLTMIRSQTEI
jgi:quercetin dioxygenase-like cupin family protein